MAGTRRARQVSAARSRSFTGATGGLGFETALGLARGGATTILAGRNPGTGARALSLIQRDVPGADVRFEFLDLASLASVASFATAVTTGQGGRIDILVNNAAVMGRSGRELTEDGFERQIGVNYLAHFALTMRLLDALRAAPGRWPGRQRGQSGAPPRHARAG